MTNHQVPLLLVGATGVGKTQIVASELSKLKPEEHLVIKMNFGARTSSEGIQSNLMSKIDRKKRGSYGPKGVGQKGIWFIDDLNLPTPDTYGFQPPLELLRQYVEMGGWFDLSELKMISIVDFSIVCAMAPPGGSKSNVPNRLLRHFFVYSAAENDKQTLIRIFSKVTDWIAGRKGLGADAHRVLGFAVEASIELFQNISEKFKPTPLKPHYLFNLRDISRVFQGLNLVFTKEYNKSALKINRMWIHETFRVMADRFTSSKDKEAFYLAVKNVMGLKLRAQMEPTIAEILPKGTILIDSYTLVEKIVFTDIMGEAIDINDREYTEQPDLGLLRKKVEMELEEYNVSRKDSMSIIIFDFAVTQILKICRILRLDKSHGVLIGLGGSGRQTLTKLSSYIMGQQPVSLEVHKAYNQDKWRTDIKKILVDACLGTKSSTLIVTESQSDNIHVMQDIDNMLNLGEIPNLFEQEEFIKHLDRLKAKAKRDGEERLAVAGSISE